ncbi:hypothetical protein, partial [Providencia stuartii]|uniref:hypothetical protein n=1 Tax=Providencia stuartii TaxID=588 RepID=UPI0013D89321
TVERWRVTTCRNHPMRARAAHVDREEITHRGIPRHGLNTTHEGLHHLRNSLLFGRVELPVAPSKGHRGRRC